MSCYFFCVGFFKRLDSFVVLFELLNLLFEFLASVIETFLKVHHLQLHFLKLLLVCFFHLFLLLFNLLFVRFEGVLAVDFLAQVSCLQLADFFFPIVSFLGPLQSVLLFSDYSVGSNQKLLDFLFVGVVGREVAIVVLFVFAVEMKDNLSELGYLL